MYQEQGNSFFEKIIFSDECNVAYRNPNVKNLFCWARIKPPCLAFTKSKANYVSVFVAVSANHKFDLIFLEEEDKGINDNTLYNADGSVKLKNKSVTGDTYRKDILDQRY